MLARRDADGQLVAVAVIVVSTLLNAGYFLPIVFRAFFRDRPRGSRMTTRRGAMADRCRACLHGRRHAGAVLSAWGAVRPCAALIGGPTPWTIIGCDATDRSALWIGFRRVLVAVVMADRLHRASPAFRLEAIFGFGAWFGFVSCVALVLLAKALGAVLKRPDGYYDE